MFFDMWSDDAILLELEHAAQFVWVFILLHAYMIYKLHHARI